MKNCVNRFQLSAPVIGPNKKELELDVTYDKDDKDVVVIRVNGYENIMTIDDFLSIADKVKSLVGLANPLCRSHHA